MKRSVRPSAPRSRKSHPARGAWIETLFSKKNIKIARSHPARGAWIETCESPIPGSAKNEVAPREGCVD